MWCGDHVNGKIWFGIYIKRRDVTIFLSFDFWQFCDKKYIKARRRLGGDDTILFLFSPFFSPFFLFPFTAVHVPSSLALLRHSREDNAISFSLAWG